MRELWLDAAKEAEHYKHVTIVANEVIKTWKKENANLRARLQDAETALQGAMAGLAERDELKRSLRQAEEQLKELK